MDRTASCEIRTPMPLLFEEVDFELHADRDLGSRVEAGSYGCVTDAAGYVLCLLVICCRAMPVTTRSRAPPPAETLRLLTTASDAEQLHQLLRTAFPAAEARDAAYGSGDVCAGLFLDGVLVGGGTARYHPRDANLEILALCAAPGRVRSGVGTRTSVLLVQQALLRFCRVRLIVLNADEPARAHVFWAKFGFRKQRHAHIDPSLRQTVPMAVTPRAFVGHVHPSSR